MDQKPIVLYPRMKGMTLALDAIYNDLVHTLGKIGKVGKVGKVGKDAVAYSTVTKYARSAQSSGRKEGRKPPLPKLEMWNAVLSMRRYSRLLPNFRFHFRLRVSFRGGSVFRDPQCTGTGTSRNRFASRCDIFDGSPLFDGEQKQIRVQMAIELLQVLSMQSTRQWHNIITLDESWIYLFNEYDLMSTAPGEIVVDRGRHTVQSPKFMLTVEGNPIGFHVLKSLPKGRKFNAQYYYIIQTISWSQSQIGCGRPGNTAEQVEGAF
jgi:hypothetical protein